MSSRIYTSHIPNIPIYSRSIFTHIVSSDNPDNVGSFPGSFPAYIDAETSTIITRANFKHAALSFAKGICTHPRLTPQSRGATLLLFAPNSIAFPVVLLGSIAAGLRCSPANTAYVPKELQHQYTDSGATIVVTSIEGLPVVLEMFRSLGLSKEEISRRVVVIGPGLAWAGGPEVKVDVPYVTLDELLVTGVLKKEEPFDGEAANETAFVCYSSGTTGRPKGVETTHANLTTDADIAKTVFKITHPHDRLLGVLPFYHIYGAVAIIVIPFLTGMPVIIQPRFDPESFCADIEKYKITIAMIVPPVLVILARHPAIDKYNLSSLSKAFSAAAPLGKDLILQVMKRFSSKGIPLSVIQGYGLTETSPIAHILPPELGLHKPGSIGLLLPNLEARIVDPDSNIDADAEEGQPGELWLRGRTVMKGYLGNVEATRESITSDGWFKTGDICVRDNEGFYWVVDRRKELIKYKGFQVPPSELESVLLTHPEIADAAVIGVDDHVNATELPRAYIVPIDPKRKDTKAFATSVQKWIENQVAGHKFLRRGVVIVDNIPKSAAGNILRRELKERAKKERLVLNIVYPTTFIVPLWSVHSY
ncbi:hypothetical protein C0995_004520 [Termitomyces sp. Mi166|nr:hypothetical protein C0995_004520 [Termitomyces sp. Mi166\